MNFDDFDGKPSDYTDGASLDLRFRAATLDLGVQGQKIIRAFENMYKNGKVLAAAFEACDFDNSKRMYLHRNRQVNFKAYVQIFIRSSAVSASLPTLVESGFRQAPFTYLSPLSLDSSLAEQLAGGGAHVEYSERLSVAKRMCSDFAVSLTGEKYEDFRVDYCLTAWTPWFKGAYWDNTWIVTDRQRGRVTLIATTDKD